MGDRYLRGRSRRAADATGAPWRDGYAAPAFPPMRLTRLTLKNWRNFHLADFPLANRMVLVGPNAVGKSNLLDALRFLRQVASPGGGFQAAVGARSGLSRVRCLAARNYDGRRVTMRVEMGNGTDGYCASYELTFAAEPRGLRRPVLKRETVTVAGEVRLDRPTAADCADPERMTQTALEQVTLNRGFREIVGFLRSIRYVHLVPHRIRAADRRSDGADDPYGAGFLRRLARTPARTRERRLERIRRALRFAAPQSKELELRRDRTGRWRLGGRCEHWRPRSPRHTEQDLSDGSLRLIGLLWSLLEGTKSEGPVLIEKPESSLHPSLVRFLPSILSSIRFNGGPQVILTTHSQVFLEDEGLGKNEVVVLSPGPEGATACLGSDLPDIQTDLDAGLTLAEIVGPATEPPGIDRLPAVFATR